MKAWIFDIDGVITNIFSKKIEQPGLVKILCEKLENKEPVGLITGKRMTTTQDQVILPIKNSIKDLNLLTLLHIEAEFGAIEINFQNGKEIINFDPSYSLSEELTLKGKAIISEYEDYVFYNEKKSFFTAEMNHGANHDDFKKIQIEIVKKLQELVDSNNASHNTEIHKDTIAVNVKNKNLNKHLGTKKFLNWLNSKNITPDIYYVFGDSESDLQIGEELFRQGKKLEFIYTGEKEIYEKPFKIIKIGKFDKGTLEYLEAN